MSVWALLSFGALVAAGLPPAYFAFRLRRSDPSYAALSLLFAAALIIHGTYHLLEFLSWSQTAVFVTETLSAALLLAFALAYWPQRGRT
ncbi:MAG TPA: hypothetical protein VJ326_05475 [Thermoplasmata archaeon]|nr:hypothetical protein [Thermoplasmata archaeon]